MNYPKFFYSAPIIRLYDPLGDFLGAFEDGEVTISYLDCAKLAGHSCPTVASTFLMVYLGLKELYPDTLPARSQIQVSLRQAKDDGVTGVMGNVISYIVGAGDEGGFKGIGSRFGRNGLVKYGVEELNSAIKLTRLDTGASVLLDSDTSVVPGSSEMMPLMQKDMQGMATAEEQDKFRVLWQSRVEAILLDQNLWSKLVTVIKKDN